MSDQDVRKLLEVAEALRGRDFIAAWLQESAPQQQIPLPPKSKRGRKPGPAADDVRCKWMPPGAERCKNTRATDANFCRIHAGKAHLLTDDASAAPATEH